MLEVGQSAPALELPDADMNLVSLADFPEGYRISSCADRHLLSASKACCATRTTA